MSETETDKEAASGRVEYRSFETQTTYVCGELLAHKIEKIVSKRSCQPEIKKVESVSKSDLNYEILCKNEKLFQFYTGLSVSQFNHLYSCLGNDVYRLDYWRANKTGGQKKIPKERKCKLSMHDQLLMTLVRLRQAFPNKDLAYRFHVSVGTVSLVVNTWIQFLYKRTTHLRKRMFPSRELIKENLPPSFKSFKNVRVIIDCFEIFAQHPRNFAEQGNMYSHYKNHSTFKVLAGIAPTGAVTFLSDAYEGSISDKEITVKSGLLDLLNPGDLVIADRGFDLKEVLQSRMVNLNIPPFLNGRSKLTPQEELLTKCIARVRIHVERSIERMKKFKIIGRTLPLNLRPVVTQIVHVIGFLVNYQNPIVK